MRLAAKNKTGIALVHRGQVSNLSFDILRYKKEIGKKIRS
jgi:hypothetical protein